MNKQTAIVSAVLAALFICGCGKEEIADPVERRMTDPEYVRQLDAQNRERKDIMAEVAAFQKEYAAAKEEEIAPPHRPERSRGVTGVRGGVVPSGAICGSEGEKRHRVAACSELCHQPIADCLVSAVAAAEVTANENIHVFSASLDIFQGLCYTNE